MNEAVGGMLRLAGGATTLRGSAVGAVRIGMYLELTRHARLGAEGVFATSGAPISSEDGPDRSEVHLGYAGIRFESRPFPGPFVLGILGGAGVARVESPLVGTSLDTRNFFLAEPSLRWEPSGAWRLRPGAGISGRIPLGSPTLVGVGARDLAGVTVDFSLQLRRLPRSSP